MIDFRSLEENGYVHLRQLIKYDDLTKFESDMNRLGKAGLRSKRLDVSHNEPLADLLQTGGDYRVRLFANLKNLKIVQEMCQSVAKRLENDGFLTWANLVVPVIYPTLRADPPGESKYLLPMHQDYATQCRNAWRLWVTLRPASEQTGTISVVPGTHKFGVIQHDVSDPAHPFVPEEKFGGEKPIVLDIPAGDGVLFNPLLVHASVPARKNLMKYILLVQVQDLTTLADESDPDDLFHRRLAMTKARDHARAQSKP